ncbi:MAG TPA: AI-2E family transporter [Firmicutes bacterium]|nr:AI-2E family transporter [Candidatus Fermentithermobacillaceae bacterium]
MQEGSHAGKSKREYIKYLIYPGIIIVSILVLVLLRKVLIPFIIAAFLSYILEPPVGFLNRRGLSRTAAISLVYLIIFTTALLIGLYFVPRFLRDLREISSEIPKYIETIEHLSARTYELGREYNLPEGFVQGVAKALSRLETRLVSAGEGLVQGIFSSAGFVPYLLLAPVIAYYILRDINKWRHQALIRMSAYPLHYMDLVRDVDRVFAGFIRGQSLVALFVTMMVWIAATLLKLRYGAVLGVISGLGEFIPYFGPAIGSIPILVVAFLNSPVTGLWALALVAFIQWFDSSVLVPRVTGERIGLHPLWVIFAIFAGGELLGFWGIFLAVPLAGIFRVLLGFLQVVLAGKNR